MAGADWIFPDCLIDRGDFWPLCAGDRFARLVEANMTEFGKSPLLPLEELADLGYAAVLYPVTMLRTSR